MKKINLLIVNILLFSAMSFGQQVEKLSPYSRVFLLEQTTNDSNTTAKINFPRKFKLSQTDNTEYINCLIKLHDTNNLDELSALGVQINTIAGNMITAQVPVNEIETLTALPNIIRVEVATPVKKRLDRVRAVTNTNQVQQGLNLPRAFTGKDVVVGIIDDGFEYGHINFYDSTKTTLRIKRVWDQWHGTSPPSGYTIGTEYTTATSMLSKITDDRTESHGTHVTGIAAGGYKGMNYWGIAPQADIVLVSYADDDVSLANGIDYIYKYANSVGKPAVVNMSLGYHIGPHDGTSLFDQMCDNLQGAGKLLVGAAGNEGSDYIHIAKTFSDVTDTLKTFITYGTTNTIANGYYGYSDFWGSPDKQMKIKLVIYKKTTNKILYQTPFKDVNLSANMRYNLSSNIDSVAKYCASGIINLATEKNSENSKPNALVMVNTNFTLSANCFLGVIIVAENGSTVNGWCADGYNRFYHCNISGWQNGDNNSTVGETGGTGKKIISVGSFNTRLISIAAPTPANDISYFSSLGPTADGRIKPDITAPGSYIISSLSSIAYNNSASDYYHFPDLLNSVVENGKTYYFAGMQGTSMATPVVTGVLALWLEAYNSLTPDDIRQIFSQTAIVDTYTGTVPNNIWGYGKIDAWAGLKYILTNSNINENTVNQQFISLKNPVENAAEITFKYNDNNVNIYLMDMNGKLIFSKNIPQIYENQTISINQTTSLPAGNYIFYFKGKEKGMAIKILKH